MNSFQKALFILKSLLLQSLYFSALMVLLILSNGNLCSGQTWLWAKKSGGFPNEESRCVVNDPSGNVIITGSFRTPILSVGATNLINRSTTGTSDALVIKYNQNGAILWATSLGGTANDAGRSVATDAAGNIYVTGYYRSSALKFANDSIPNTSNTFADMFVAKLSPAGAFLWVRHLNGTVNEFGNGIATNAAGISYVTGYYSSDTLIVNNDTLLNHAPGALDILLVKIDSQGNFIWGRTYGGPGSDQGQSVVNLTGERFGLTAYYNSDTLMMGNNTLLNLAPGFDDFITAVYDSSGTLQWTKTFGSVSDDRAYGIGADNFGNLLLAGRYGSPTLQFDTITLQNFNPNFTADFFAVKMNANNGHCAWARSLGDSLDEIGEGICADLNGKIYAIGRFSSNQLSIGNRSFNNYVNLGTSDIFLTAFDSTGTSLWSVTAGKSANDYGMSVATMNNRIYITGYFRDTSITFGNFNLINGGAGNQDIFTAALGPPSPLPVELIQFNGYKKDTHSILLNWSTASELNNDHFILEKSSNGTAFEIISIIPGKNNSNFFSEYNFIDENAIEQTLFYRLSQVDLDGSIKTYDPIFIENNNKRLGPFLLSTTTQDGKLIIHYQTPIQELASINVMDHSGRNCLSMQETFNSTSNQLSIDLNHLENGIYLLSFSTPYTYRIFKIIKV